MSSTVKTTCPYCGVGCGVTVEKMADGSVGVTGDENHPANYGRLCSKGSALGETVDLEGRLLHPLVNDETTDWPTALDLVADTFARTIEQHGPDSVAFYLSGQLLTEDYYVANKLIKGFMGTANIDTNSRLCMASSVAGHKRAFGSDTVPNTYEDLERADVVVLVGSNLTWCHPVIAQRIEHAHSQDATKKLVVIDPKKTRTADVADVHLAIKPDSDGVLFQGLLRWLVDKRHINQTYVQQHTEGFEKAVQQADVYTPEHVAEQTGLGIDDVIAFYTLWGGTERVVTGYSQGVNQSTCGTDKVNAILNCHLASGRIGTEGSGPFSLTGQPNAMGGREVGGLANMLAAHMDIDNPDHQEITRFFWQAPNLATSVGLKAVDLFDAVSTGKIKAIWIMATNPVVSMPEAEKVRQALENCDFVVVSDVLANTDTINTATVKLPSLGWAEKDGTVTNSERRISRQRGFLPAPGEAKADWWQLSEVAKRMGWSEFFNYTTPADIFREHAALTSFENEGHRDLNLEELAELSNEEYDALNPYQWGSDADGSTDNNQRFFADGRFYTPNAKARFIPIKPVKLEANDAQTTPSINISNDKLLVSLNTGRVRDQWHTMTRTGKSARLADHYAEPYCEVNPLDAEQLGVQDAELIQITKAEHTVVLRALINKDQSQGHIFVPFHWNDQWASAARINSLVASNVDPFSGQPALKSGRVTISRAHMPYHGFVVSRNKPSVTGLDYWALAKAREGWRLEFALKQRPDDIDVWMNQFASGAEPAQAYDFQRENWRRAEFKQQQLQSLAYFSKGLVSVSRSWATQLLSETFDAPCSRYQVLAGFPGAGAVDKGAIICACMNVGLNELTTSVLSGHLNVNAVGEDTGAGTGCGSCRIDIRKLIEAHTSSAPSVATVPTTDTAAVCV